MFTQLRTCNCRKPAHGVLQVDIVMATSQEYLLGITSNLFPREQWSRLYMSRQKKSLSRFRLVKSFKLRTFLFLLMALPMSCGSNLKRRLHVIRVTETIVSCVDLGNYKEDVSKVFIEGISLL